MEHNISAKQEKYKNVVQESSLKQIKQHEEFLNKMKFDKERKDKEIELIEKERKKQEQQVAKQILSQQVKEKSDIQIQKNKIDYEFDQGNKMRVL